MKKNILSWLLVVSMVIPMLSSGIIAKAEEGTTTETEVKSVTVSEATMEISQYRGNPYTSPEKEGYLFGGWYQDAECKAPIGEDVKEGNYYAKFVPEEVLGVKAQVSANLKPPAQIDGSTTGAIRFVTSVDSLDYQKVGFKITANGTTFESENNNKVYGELFYIDTNGTGVTKDPQSVTPQKLFGEAAQYFKTQTFTGIPSGQFHVEMEVVPFWVTLDGTVVNGASATKSVDAGIQAGQYYVVNSYDELQTVLKFINDNNLTDEKVIKVAQSFEIPSMINIMANRKIVLQNDEEAASPITLYRGSNLTATNMFNVAAGGTLTIRGVGESDSFVLDGKTQAGQEVIATTNLILDAGTLVVENVTMQNAKTSSGGGGAIRATGAGLQVTGCTFKNNNVAGSGAAIYSSITGSLSIKDSTFTGNQAKAGGAVYIIGSNATTSIICDTTFTGNKSVNEGGAIRFSRAGNSEKLIVTDCSFANNEAGGGGGGAIYSNAATTLNGTDVEKAYFRNNIATAATGKGGAVCISSQTLAGSGYIFEGGNTPQAISVATPTNNKYIEYSITNIDELKEAVSAASALDTTNAVCMKITESFEFSRDISITTGNIVLYNEGGTKEAPVMITRKPSDTDVSGIFTVAQGAALTIYGVGEQGSFVLDGRTQAEIGEQVSIEDAKGQSRTLITNNGNLTIDNIKIQYMKKLVGAVAVIDNTEGSKVTIRDSVFDQNRTVNGGAGVLRSTNSEVRIEGSTFTNNQAGGKVNGGAILSNIEVGKTGTLTIENSEFVNNTANQGGAVYYSAFISEEYTCTIMNTEFTDNTATDAGGALRNAGGTMKVTDCQFKNNTAAITGGGAIYNNKELYLFGTDATKAFFKSNQATGTSGQGGAVFSGGTLRGSGYLFENNTPDDIYNSGNNLYQQ